ncbi:hypothetical protein QUB16_24660 [Microcoleus sp. D3_18a_C4]
MDGSKQSEADGGGESETPSSTGVGKEAGFRLEGRRKNALRVRDRVKSRKKQ